MSETSASKTIGPGAATMLERSRLTFDLDVDVAVVGAGLAGLTVAREAARLGASVAVLEGRHVGWNASGHQLGTVMPGYGLPIGELIARIGFEDTRELWALSREGAEYVRAMASESSMAAIALGEGALEVSNVQAGDQLISRLQTLGEDFETEVEGWQVERVRAELKTDRYFHGVYYPKAFQVDGRKYVHGLAALARRGRGHICGRRSETPWDNRRRGNSDPFSIHRERGRPASPPLPCRNPRRAFAAGRSADRRCRHWTPRARPRSAQSPGSIPRSRSRGHSRRPPATAPRARGCPRSRCARSIRRSADRSRASPYRADGATHSSPHAGPRARQ